MTPSPTLLAARALLVLAATAALVLPAVPAQAGTPEDPEVRDRAGDAYAVNGQGVLDGLEEAPSMHPGSISSADLVAIWFETTYTTDIERDAAGDVLAVRHVADGVRVNIQTAAPATPTFGPGVVIRVPGSIGDCRFNIEVWISGATAGTPLERPARADVSPLGCSDLQHTDIALAFEGNLTRAHIPLAATGGLFHVGAELNPHPTSKPHLRTQLAVTAPVVDETTRGRPFLIGADVPPDVACSATPADPACSR